MRLFIGNLDFSADENDLRGAFAPYGTVTAVNIVLDRETGRPRGFGFVEYANSNDARDAIAALDGKDLRGRNLRVSEAHERTTRNHVSANHGR